MRETRSSDVGRGRVIDESQRYRRQKKVLEALEQDNFHEEPHSDLVMNKKAPKFQESIESGPRSSAGKKRKNRSEEYYRQKYRKNFGILVEEDLLHNRYNKGNYRTAAAKPSSMPKRNFCNVCGFFSTYNCVQCGTRFCSTKCNATHKDTRCQKWTQ